MSSYRQILYHIIFRTKDGNRTLQQEAVKELYAYIHGIIKAKNCFLYRINGTEDHIHLLSDLHPNLALADYVRDIKTASSLMLKKHSKFPDFEGWAEGYAALTYAWNDKDNVVNYIRNQQEHHKTTTFLEEYKKLLEDFGIDIDDRYFP